MTQVEFLFDFASPNCYVAYHKLRELNGKWGLDVRLVPLFLGGLFKVTNDGPVSRGTNEYNYMVANLERISRTLGIELDFPHSSFPPNSVRALRGVYFAESKGSGDDYVSRVFREYWVKGTDISDHQRHGEVAATLSLNRDEILEYIEREETKLRLRKETERAYERGVFGAPTYFVDGKMYWGTPEVLWLLDDELARADTHA